MKGLSMALKTRTPLFVSSKKPIFIHFLHVFFLYLISGVLVTFNVSLKTLVIMTSGHNYGKKLLDMISGCFVLVLYSTLE